MNQIKPRLIQLIQRKKEKISGEEVMKNKII